MSSTTRRGGGCLSAAQHPAPLFIEIASEATKNWISKARVGDDQGQDGACVIFAMCNWFEAMKGVEISSSDALSIYSNTLEMHGRESGGLYPHEGIAGMKSAGLLRKSSKIERSHSLTDLNKQPLLAVYKCGQAWQKVSNQGCLDHLAPPPPLELHMVVALNKGMLDNPHAVPGQYVWLQNSWGLNWGWKGLGIMNYGLHLRDCWEMWRIEL